jgi:phage gpG-like protein
VSVFYVNTYGIKHTLETFEGVVKRAADTRPAMEEIYLTILDIEQEAFDREGARGGFSVWEKNALSTLVKKVKARGTSKILQETDRLMKSMTTPYSADAFVRINKTSIQMQPRLSAIPYGRAQMLGQPGHFPARDYLRFSKSDAAAFGREVSRHLMRRRGPGKISVEFS